MADREDQAPSKSLGARLRGAFGKARETGAASLRVAQRTVSSGVSGAGERLKSGQAAVGHAVEARRFVKQAQEAQERGNHAMAFRLLEEHLAEHGDDPRYVLALWAAAIACEQPDDAVPAMKKLVRRLAGSGKALRAAELWMELEAGAPGALVDAGSLVRIAPALIEDGQPERAIEALRQALHPDQVALSLGLAVRVTEMARELDPQTALVAARHALENPDLNAAKRERLEALRSELEKAAAEAAAAAAKTDPAQSGESAAAQTPAAKTTATGISDFDAEHLADEIAATASEPSTETSVDETVSQRFVDLGEGEDLELDLGTPGSGSAAAVEGESFVDLAPEEEASPTAADAEAGRSIEAPPPPPRPEPRHELDPAALDLGEEAPSAEPAWAEADAAAPPTAGPGDPFDAEGLDLGASGSDLGLPDGEEHGSDLDLELAMPEARGRDLAEETIFDGGDLGSLGGAALEDDAVDAVLLDPEELAALGEDDLPVLDALEAPEPVAPDTADEAPRVAEAVGAEGDLVAEAVGAEGDLVAAPPATPRDDPFAAPPAAQATSGIPEVQGELTGEVVAEDPSALAEVATPVVEATVEALAPAARFSEVKVMQGAPRELAEVGIVLDLPGGRRGRVEYAKIEALAVAEVGGLAAHPVVVVDLLMNWNGSGDVALRAVRLRSDGFDPCTLVAGEERPAVAFRAFLAALLERSGATPLPDPELRPRRYEDLADYERELLGVGA